MIAGKKILAIIPARGGSKRLPRKNILPLGGKPLIQWTIEAAKNSDYIDDVFVSTDDEEIVETVKMLGIEVPEFRPERLSTDKATTKSVLFYTLEKFGSDADIVIVLQPTSPLRRAKHIDEAIELLVKKSAFSIISVTPCEHPPQWSNSLPESGSMKNFIRARQGARSQDFDTTFRLNGAIYIYDVDKLYSYGDITYQEDTYAYEMENRFSIDIDNQMDLDMANFFMEMKPY